MKSNGSSSYFHANLSNQIVNDPQALSAALYVVQLVVL